MDAHVVMLGTVSPAAGSYDETLQTLLYAERLQRLRSAVATATPVKRMVDKALVATVLEDPARLLHRIAAFQQNHAAPPAAAGGGDGVAQTPRAAPLPVGLTPLPNASFASPSAFGSFLSPGVERSALDPASPGGDSGALSSARKASMRGLEVSDPRQRLVRLSDFLRRKAGLPARTSEPSAPSTPSREAAPGTDAGGAGTPSRNSVRAHVLPTRDGRSPPPSPPPGNHRGGSGGGGAEVSRLKHAYSELEHDKASMEMELHSVKVDCDMLELRLKEAMADVAALRGECGALRGTRDRAEALAAENASLKAAVAAAAAEAEQLRGAMASLRTEALAAVSAAASKEAEVLEFSQEMAAAAAAAAEREAANDRFDALCAAWATWRAVVEVDELSRMRAVSASVSLHDQYDMYGQYDDGTLLRRLGGEERQEEARLTPPDRDMG